MDKLIATLDGVLMVIVACFVVIPLIFLFKNMELVDTEMLVYSTLGFIFFVILLLMAIDFIKQKYLEKKNKVKIE